MFHADSPIATPELEGGPCLNPTRRPKTVERRISALFATYLASELTADGNYRETSRTAQRGELISLPLAEAARLDALGALGPVGCTTQSIEDDIAATYEAYASARRGLPETG